MPKKNNLIQSLKPLILIILLFTVISCRIDDEVSVFEEELDYISLEEKSTYLFSEIFNPRTIQFVDQKLYVTEAKNPDVSFHVLNIRSEDNSLSYEEGVGRRGRGPGEFLEINDITATDSVIYIYDGSQLKMVSYNPITGELASYDDINLRTSGRPTNIYSFAEDQFVGIGLFIGSRYIIMSANGETVSEHGELIEFNSEFSQRNNVLAWLSFGTVHPVEPYVYLFSLNADFIEKYNGDGELIQRVQGAENPIPDMGIRNESPFHVGNVAYLSIDSDENYIYGLYSGRTRENEGMRGNIIHKFDWELNLVDAYKLDKYFNQITVDGSGNLYTFGETGEGIEFYVYEL